MRFECLGLASRAALGSRTYAFGVSVFGPRFGSSFSYTYLSATSCEPTDTKATLDPGIDEQLLELGVPAWVEDVLPGQVQDRVALVDRVHPTARDHRAPSTTTTPSPSSCRAGPSLRLNMTGTSPRSRSFRAIPDPINPVPPVKKTRISGFVFRVKMMWSIHRAVSRRRRIFRGGSPRVTAGGAEIVTGRVPLT